MLGGMGGSFGGGGVKKYATVDDLPLTGVKAGTLAHVELNLQGVSALYLWNGSQISGGWYKVATVNLAPAIIQGPDASYSLPNDGSALTLTLVADDPEGLPISWSVSSPDGDLTGSAVIAQNGNVFSISADPSLIETQTAASFSLTFKASDGVSLSAATSVFTLSFSIGPADPAQLTLVGEYPIFDDLGVDFRFLVAVGGKKLIGIATSATTPETHGLYAIDFSDPQAPTLISYYRPPSMLATSGTWAYFDGILAVAGSGNTNVVSVVDVSNLLAMQEISNISTYRGGVAGFARDGKYLVVISEIGPVTSYDMTDPSSPTVASSFATSSALPLTRGRENFASDVVIARDGSTSKPIVFGVSETGALTLVASAAFTAMGSVGNDRASFDGTFLAIASNSASAPLQLYDVSGQTPVLYSMPAEGRVSRGTFVLDGFVYVASTTDDDRLSLYDIRDLTSIQSLGPIAGSGQSGAISTYAYTFADNRLYAYSDDTFPVNDKKLRIFE